MRLVARRCKQGKRYRRRRGGRLPACCCTLMAGSAAVRTTVLAEELRVAGMIALEQANRLLREQHIAEFNEKFAA